MITIIFGDPGSGKSGILTFIGNEAAFDRERNVAMRQEIRFRNANGFNLTVPRHAVSSNIENMRFMKPFTYVRRPRIIDPSRLGIQKFAPEGFKCHYTLPYETILIDEAQAYFYSKSKGLEKFQLDFFDKARHNDLDIYMTTPSAMSIHKDIRRLARFWHIKGREVVYKRDGSVETRWKVNEFPGGETAVEDYSAGNLKFETKVIKAPYNIFNLYNHKANRSMFVEGHLSEDFDLMYPDDSELITLEDYKKHEAKFLGNSGNG